jgi:nitrate reductase gamma subunit
MGIGFSLFAVVILVLVALLGAGAAKAHLLFGVIIPYLALATFIAGVMYRVLKWARAPVPFHIPTTCGQQKSLPWINANNIESPYNTLGVVGRMALEVLLFRSLFRNTKVKLYNGPKIVYGGEKWLWLAGMAFHWSLLFILLRHLRFFIEPMPSFLNLLQNVDGFFQLAVPTVYMTDMVILAAVSYLFVRRIVIPQMRYISLPNDYFPLLLLLGIAITGVLTRHFYKVDIFRVKELALGLVILRPSVPEGIGLSFYVHLFLVSVLLSYFPFSKLMHMGGVFLSPTRNLMNDSRMRRHVNPLNYPVKLHTYEEWEDDFRDRMKHAGIPLDKE